MTNGDDKTYDTTKREYFAAMAMQGLCANSIQYDLYGDFYSQAEDAVKIADALIEALNAKD